MKYFSCAACGSTYQSEDSFVAHTCNPQELQKRMKKEMMDYVGKAHSATVEDVHKAIREYLNEAVKAGKLVAPGSVLYCLDCKKLVRSDIKTSRDPGDKFKVLCQSTCLSCLGTNLSERAP